MRALRVPIVVRDPQGEPRLISASAPLAIRWRSESRAVFILTAALFVALSLAGASRAIAFDHKALAAKALMQHIRPGYQSFAKATEMMVDETGNLCRDPSQARLDKARATFRKGLLAWGRIEHVRFGPIADERRFDRLMFWPDPKGLGRRQVEKLLADFATAPVTAEQLAGKSVAVQGFTALDSVIFGPGSEALALPPTDAPRCRCAKVLAENIRNIAQTVAAEWMRADGYAAVWLAPGPENPIYLSEKETTRALLQAYLSGLDMARNQRLAGPLGFQQKNVKGGIRALAPPFPHSHLAVPLIAANIEGLRNLLQNSGFLDPVLVAGAPDNADTAGILATIVGELDRAIASATTAATETTDPFATRPTNRHLIAMGFPLKNAYETGGRSIADAAGVTIGFNALDGD